VNIAIFTGSGKNSRFQMLLKNYNSCRDKKAQPQKILEEVIICQVGNAEIAVIHLRQMLLLIHALRARKNVNF
jgi:hypothetical protein